MGEHDTCWAVETSKDGDRWRFYGKAWARDGEPILLHAAPAYLRFKLADGGDWSEPLKSTSESPMALVRLDEGVREDVWPSRRHLGLPVVLPGGEAGRLVSFWRSPDGERWTYTLEFRGERP